MGWVWTGVVVWVLLAVPAAVVLGRAIRRADHRELGEAGEPPLPLTGPRPRPLP